MMNTQAVHRNTTQVPVQPGQLIHLVTALLAQAGHPNPTAWQAYLPLGSTSLTDLNAERRAINRAWRVILHQLPQINTTDIRFSLIEDGNINDWLRHFQTGVMPCILRYNLPISMH